MQEILNALKAFLREQKNEYVFENSWIGDTEAGFHTEVEFDMDKLMEQIDRFGEELRANQSRDHRSKGETL